jgi:predicted lipid-binding transport protein (Tim44 family)
MSRRFPLPITTVLVALSLAAAACSGGGSAQLSHDDYQKKILQLGAEFQAKEQKAFGNLNIQNPGDLAKLGDKFREAADGVDNLADELSSVNPPDDAADANAKFVDGFHKAADALRELAKAADDKDFQKLRQLGTSLQNSDFAKELTKAGDELKAAGYRIPNQ